ncbi:CaiB/BaiF CoA-transferase family protein [Bacillus sp. V5-8f]|uniref:CaiB/BaiF CoA transferase family protein n=1 Tax=Bacillus sp. V5-8f TaxID=2053044 RepID=UPI000C77D760|nr:CaiB/BaiF CoA-transferase family protein [Bacillus sp. V5-8f]PLT35692.1 CoA transferase [Bacillus sp. V5-8f]
MGALKGLRVLDLTRVLAGPYCTMILGDMGADVLKVEAPGGSDDTREWGPPYAENVSAYYLSANRNKRAMTLNLKSEPGKEIIKKLIAESDVVIENFKTGTLEKLGLGYEDLRKVNPGIVYCSITGFGQTGPYKDLPGYDFIIQAMSGLMSITGEKQSGPMKVGVAISDVITGLYAAVGILAALNERQTSGVGQSIDISLFDSQLSALVNVASNFLVSELIPEPLGNEHPNIVPYQTFQASDRQLAIAVGNDRQFKNLCLVLGKEQLASDERFATNSQRVKNKELLINILSDAIKEKPAVEWVGLLNDQGIPCGPINNLKQVFQDPQIKERNLVWNCKHPTAGDVSLVGSPLKFSRTPTELSKHPPTAGEHTVDILRELDYSEEQINEYKKAKII